MFGGLTFLLDGNLAVGITSTGELMVRVGTAGEDEALADPHARRFEMTGRPMDGWIVMERADLRTAGCQVIGPLRSGLAAVVLGEHLRSCSLAKPGVLRPGCRALTFDLEPDVGRLLMDASDRPECRLETARGR